LEGLFGVGWRWVYECVGDAHFVECVVGCGVVVFQAGVIEGQYVVLVLEKVGKQLEQLGVCCCGVLLGDCDEGREG